MEQIIQAAFSGGAQGKSAVGSTGLLNMTGVSSDKVKTAGTQSGDDQEDSTALVPFIQLLHRQMSQTSESSDDNELSVVREREHLMLPDEATLKELQQVLANAVQSGETAGLDQSQNVQTANSFDDLLKEMESLKNNLVRNDGKGNDPLLDAVFAQAGVEEKVINGENKILDVMTASLEKEIAVQSNNSGSGQVVNEQNVILNTSDGIIGGEVKSILFSENESSKTYKVESSGMDLRNLNTMSADKAKADYLMTQAQQENQPAKEDKIKSQGMNVQSASQTDERMLQMEKMITRADQFSEGAAGKMAANSVQVKTESKIANNTPPVDSEKEIYTAGDDLRLTQQEIKESRGVQDNFRFIEKQYSNSPNAGAVNKAQLDTMQAMMGEITGNVKTEQNAKIISGEKGKEEISLTGFSVAAGGRIGVEKTSDVSPDKIIAQVTNEVKEAAANDGGRVKITLNPPSLGKVEMDVTVRNGKVEVIMVADNKDVQQTLNTHIDKLKGGLQNQGLTIDRCDVFMQDKREEYQQNFSQQAFYQDRGSGQEGNGRRENSEKEIKVSAIISEKPGSVLKVSTDNISLFA